MPSDPTHSKSVLAGGGIFGDGIWEELMYHIRILTG